MVNIYHALKYVSTDSRLTLPQSPAISRNLPQSPVKIHKISLSVFQPPLYIHPSKHEFTKSPTISRDLPQSRVKIHKKSLSVLQPPLFFYISNHLNINSLNLLQFPAISRNLPQSPAISHKNPCADMICMHIDHAAAPARACSAASTGIVIDIRTLYVTIGRPPDSR